VPRACSGGTNPERISGPDQDHHEERVDMSYKPWVIKRLSGAVTLAVLAASLLFLAPTLQAAMDPLNQIKATVDSIITILKDKQLAAPEMRATRRNRVEELVDGVFDFQEMGKKTLSDTWDTMSAAAQKEFVDLLARMVKQRYIGKIDSYAGQEVVFKNQRQKGTLALVYSDLLDNNTEIPIDYKMMRNGDQWVVYDLKIENISLVANYRSDFSRIIKKDGVPALLKKMRETVDQFEADK
jgi:phospholipid transport system substrate-binding protein